MKWLPPPPSIAEIEQRQQERKLQLMFEKGRKAAKVFLQCEAAGLPTHASPRLVRIRQIATIDREEILEESAKANNGKRDYAYAFGALTEMMNHVAWLAQLEPK